jgi:uncharacterized protein (UPF0332 family)
MTDMETLFSYRYKQAEETLLEAQKMLEAGFSPRSIINRAYYSTILHDLFDARQEGDYKEFVELNAEDAAGFVKLANDFLKGIKKLVAD